MLQNFYSFFVHFICTYMLYKRDDGAEVLFCGENDAFNPSFVRKNVSEKQLMQAKSNLCKLLFETCITLYA